MSSIRSAEWGGRTRRSRGVVDRWLGPLSRCLKLGLLGLLLAQPGLGHANDGVGIESEMVDDESRELPDSERPWGAKDYERALEVLEDMPPSALPRLAGADRSRLLFERLLAAREHTPQDLVGDEGGSTLLGIYTEAVALDAGLWPELIEIGRRELEIRCRAALSRSVLEGAREAEIRRFETSPQSERDAEQLETQLALYDESIQHVSTVVGSAAERQILFGHDGTMDSEARARWVAALEATAGCVAERVLEEEGARLSERLHEGSRLPWNADVALELHRIADRLTSESRLHGERLAD